jgi:putative membrane protein
MAPWHAQTPVQSSSRSDTVANTQPPTQAIAPPTPSNNELASVRTSLAADRSLMAADRSLMAWVRTGLSLISFGFTIYKFLEGMQSGANVEQFAHSPRVIGLFLVGVGTGGILAGTVEYWFHRKDLLKYRHYHLWRPSFLFAMLLSFAGVLIFTGMAARVL